MADDNLFVTGRLAHDVGGRDYIPDCWSGRRHHDSVAASSSSVTTIPTGTLTVVVDGTTETSSLALSSGSATYTLSSATAGSHVITATYSGDSTFAASTGTLTVTVGASTGTFTLAATNLTVSAGNSGTSTITITPTNGYTGTIGWTVSSSPSLSNGCYSVPDATVSSTSAVTAVLSVYTSASASHLLSTANEWQTQIFGGTGYLGTQVPPFFLSAVQASLIMAGLLFAGSFRGRSHKARRFPGALVMVAIGLMLAGCGGSSSSSSSSSATKGTYTLTIVERTRHRPPRHRLR